MLRITCARRRQGGFSIVELLIVIAIIAVLALAGAPWFAKISQRNQLKSVASELAITLAAARGRAVRRNLPVQVVVTRGTGAIDFHLVETFEQTLPSPTKVGEQRITKIVDFPVGPLALPYDIQATQVVFLPDGRVQGGDALKETAFTLRGVRGAGVTNDLPVTIAINGRVQVLGPNPTVSKPRGTAWK